MHPFPLAKTFFFTFFIVVIAVLSSMVVSAVTRYHDHQKEDTAQLKKNNRLP